MVLMVGRVGGGWWGRRLSGTPCWGSLRKDFPPAVASPEVIASFCFLDTSTGWVLLAGADGDNTRFDLASTTNAGESWSIKPVRIPNLDQVAYPIGVAAHIDVVNSLHDWRNSAFPRSPRFRI